MKSTIRIAPVGYEEDDDIFEDASEQAFINPEEEFYEGKYYHADCLASGFVIYKAVCQVLCPKRTLQFRCLTEGRQCEKVCIVHIPSSCLLRA